MTNFTLTSKFISWFGPEFRITDEKGILLAFVKQKAFRLKEEITLYKDEQKKQPFMTIKARNIIDFQGTYDLLNDEGRVFATFQRRGFASVIQDEWWILDGDGQKIGEVIEDSLRNALIRRMLFGSLMPQTYRVTLGNTSVGTISQKFHIFRYQVNVDYDEKLMKTDTMLGLSVLLAAIEGKETSNK